MQTEILDPLAAPNSARRGRPHAANPKSNAQRQREYRLKRRAAGEHGEANLNLWLDNSAKFALERLAVYWGISERETLEQLIISADRNVLAGFGNLDQSYAYLDRKIVKGG